MASSICYSWIALCCFLEKAVKTWVWFVRNKMVSEITELPTSSGEHWLSSDILNSLSTTQIQELKDHATTPHSSFDFQSKHIPEGRIIKVRIKILENFLRKREVMWSYERIRINNCNFLGEICCMLHYNFFFSNDVFWKYSFTIFVMRLYGFYRF